MHDLPFVEIYLTNSRIGVVGVREIVGGPPPLPPRHLSFLKTLFLQGMK
jgi:hypothetical protein